MTFRRRRVIILAFAGLMAGFILAILILLRPMRPK